MYLRSHIRIKFKDVGWVWQTEAPKVLNNRLSPTAPIRLRLEGMSDDRSLFKAEPGQGQELKRTYNTSFGAAKEGHISGTNNSGKEEKDSSPEGTVEKVSISCWIP